jgi:hypothetical protein
MVVNTRRKVSKEDGASGVAGMKNEGPSSPCVESRMLWLLRVEW